MNRFLIFIFILICWSNSAFAQRTPLSTENKKAISFYQAGLNNSRRFQYEEAVENFENAIRKDGSFIEAYFALGSVYKKAKDYSSAIRSFEQGIAATPTQDKVYKFYGLVGETYFAAKEYKKARGYLNAYLENNKQIKPDTESKYSLLLIHSKFAEEAIKNPVEFDPEIVSKSVNRFPVQYFPVLTADESQMIYTARKAIKPGFDEDIYIARKDSLNNWQRSKLISPNISRQGINEGACSISADGRVLVFTICRDRRGLGSCDLYISKKVGDNWSYPKNMKAPINSPKWESQPALSADGRTLYFVSDRAGGIGKLDIWKSTINDEGVWSKPLNLGETVNTPYDDITPFIHANGKNLYFSSKGHPGFGGHDLFRTSKLDSSWTKPVNMGYPVNDMEDQISLFVTPNGQTGYFSREEEENFQYRSEIYRFSIPEGDRVEVKSIYLSGKVSDKETKKYLGSQIEIFNQESSEEVFKVQSDSVNGEYLVVLNEGGRYGMYVSRPGYLFKELDFDLKQSDKLLSYYTLNIELEKVKAGTKKILKNIFFDFDKFELKESSIPELEVFADFMKKNKTVKVEIQGHTDNNGGEEYNQQLSENRAKAVYLFLINKGISKSRLLYSGKGSSKPLADNNSEEGRGQNRRIEFIIR
ncbi:MAG: OmpA family protein [Bacteroidota bacterium]